MRFKMVHFNIGPTWVSVDASPSFSDDIVELPRFTGAKDFLLAAFNLNIKKQKQKQKQSKTKQTDA